MRLLAELCRVVEEREDPGPWLRRAVASAADALKRAPRLKTWHMERAVYVSALLGAVWAQHHETLGTPSSSASGLIGALGGSPEVSALVTVVVLGVALLRTVDGAELDSIGTREREQAEAEGREPVKVECSPRAGQLRARGPWMDLALLAFAFGWVGTVGFAWRLTYPLWRRWWRSRYGLAVEPAFLKPLSWQAQPTVYTCGQTCVAMLTGLTVAQVCEEMGRWGRTGDSGIWLVLQTRGLEMDHAGAQRAPVAGETAVLHLRHADGRGHWALWADGLVLDPGLGGPLTLAEAQSLWAASAVSLVTTHQVTPLVMHRYSPTPSQVAERLAQYRSMGESPPPAEGDRERIAAHTLGSAEPVHATWSAAEATRHEERRP